MGCARKPPRPGSATPIESGRRLRDDSGYPYRQSQGADLIGSYSLLLCNHRLFLSANPRSQVITVTTNRTKSNDQICVSPGRCGELNNLLTIS